MRSAGVGSASAVAVGSGVGSVTATSLPHRAGRAAGRPCTSSEKCSRATRWLGSSSSGSGSARNARISSAPRSSASNQRNPSAAQLGADRVGPDRDRAAGDRGLDRRVAEALPGRREHDDVGRGVDVGPVGERVADHPAAGTARAADRARARSPPRPRPAASRSRRAPRSSAMARRRRPCARWPAPGGRPAARRRRRRGASRVPVAIARRRRRVVEAVVDRGRASMPRSAISRCGQPVDGDVAPRRIVGRQLGDVGEARALPRRIVVVQDRRPPAQDLGHRRRRGR